MAKVTESLSKDIDKLVGYKRSHPPKNVANRTRQDLSQNIPLLDSIQFSRLVEDSISRVAGTDVSSNTVVNVGKFCIEAVESLNQLSDERRFFVLETVNLFGEQSALARFVELLLHEGVSTRKALAMLFLSTFRSTHEVILTITAPREDSRLTTSEAEKGELYVFRSDLARRLLKLFSSEFLQNQARIFQVEDVHPIELLIHIVDGNSSAELRKAIVHDNAEIVIRLVEYLVLLQSHYALYIYAIKRYEYLKNFLLYELRQDGKLQGFPASEISKLVAGGLVSNVQLSPPDDLIYNLIQSDKFGDEETIEAEREFLDKLTPSTLDHVIREVHTTVKKMAQSSEEVAAVFEEVRQLSEEESPLARLEAGFLALVEQGVIAVSDLVRDIRNIFKAKRERARKAKESREQALEKARNFVPTEKTVPKRKRYTQIKSVQALKSLSNYRLVVTDRSGFRGGDGKTIARDFAESMMIFGRDEVTFHHFKKAFLALFEFFKRTPEFYNKFEILEHPHPTGDNSKFYEYYASFRIPDLDDKVLYGKPHLFCFGVTHFPNREAVSEKLQGAYDAYESEIDPYVILLVGDPTVRSSARALSRKVDGKGRTFNHVPLLEAHVRVMHHALHDILHMLPEEDGAFWNDESTQHCLGFLRKSIARRGG